MKSATGLCIDPREAVIVLVTDEGEERRRISSNMEKYVRFPAVLGVCRSNRKMPVLGGTKTITWDEIVDPEPNVKDFFLLT